MTDDRLFGETDFEEENQRLRRENECLLSKNKRLTAFLVEKNLATEYILWQKGVVEKDKKYDRV